VRKNMCVDEVIVAARFNIIYPPIYMRSNLFLLLQMRESRLRESLESETVSRDEPDLIKSITATFQGRHDRRRRVFRRTLTTPLIAQCRTPFNIRGNKMQNAQHN
jgi:hypothetical protein